VRTITHVLTLIMLVLGSTWTSTLPSAADPDVGGGVKGDTVFVSAVEASAGNQNVDSSMSQLASAGSAGSAPSFVEYRWISVCTDLDSSPEGSTVLDCTAARSCADPVERLWRLWGRTDGQGWTPLSTECFGRPPTVADAPEPPQPVVTPALVLNAIRQIGLPSLEAVTQPEDKTLVNFETIFYTDPQQFTQTVTLLGQSVEIEATPSQVRSGR
jgi:hypothetical protein